MIRNMQSQNLMSKMWLRAARAALALAMVPAFGVLATPSAQAQTYKVLKNFDWRPDGSIPMAGLVVFGGKLYGTTYSGGIHRGTVFEMDKMGNETVLHNFQGLGWPVAGLVADSAGNLYGTVSNGGAHEAGAVFKIDTTGAETVLYKFKGGADGGTPYAGLLRDSAGNLYGTTRGGTVFKVDTTGAETTLYTFKGPPDGDEPVAGLVRDGAGNFYGTTASGGNTSGPCAPSGCGIVFKLDTTGKETVLYSFTGVPDGQYPAADLVLDAAGDLYGTTGAGGAGTCAGWPGCGTVFKVNKTTGMETVLYSFAGGTDGAHPEAGLARDAAGNLYGTTAYGGNAICTRFFTGCGTVFKLDTTGAETILHRFVQTDGANPFAGLLQKPAGTFYGTTAYGGRLSRGVVFKLKP
jgi:uncharacterized repeat protein (TIGR03803 family)